MITATLKDGILKWLCFNTEPEVLGDIDISDLLVVTNTDFDTLNAVLTYFDRIGFLEELNSRRVAISLIVRIEAHDFLLRGGFVAQEELLESNIKKLLLEIENVKPQLLDKGEKIATIGSAILSALSLMWKG